MHTSNSSTIQLMWATLRSEVSPVPVPSQRGNIFIRFFKKHYVAHFFETETYLSHVGFTHCHEDHLSTEDDPVCLRSPLVIYKFHQKAFSVFSVLFAL